MRKFILFIGFISLAVLSHAQYKSQVWVSDQGDGTYVNPVINADYSDPDACAVDGNFYMTASSFNCTPGLPILHSTNLVNWRIINYAIKDVEPADYYASPRHGKGVWAPSIRHHNGEFYIYWGDPDFGIFMVKTKDIYGEWEKPVLVKAGKGMIDPCPLWDEDGKVYLAHAWAGSRAGFNSIITVCEMNSEGTAIVSAPVMVFDGNDGTNHTIEGAKFYKRNGYYYIFAPAGGVTTGWQLVLRSKSVYGPYEPRIVMAQGKTDINGPHQGAWVDTPSGESWFLHFQDKGAYGRVLHLNPMEWKSDWPVIGIDNDGDGCGDPVTAYRKPRTEGKNVIETPAESDEFNSRHLGLQWQWHANYHDFFGFTTDLGYIRLYGYQLSEDYTSYHVAVYDTITGECINRCTHQGYADNSMWARGQAWAIYGYTVVYRETREPKYLDFAEKVAQVYLDRLPEDYIPYWDFSAPGIPNAPRDASAACVVASALLELSTFYTGEQADKYKNAAIKMLVSLDSDKYRAGETNHSLLLHSTGHWPNKSEIDASIIYADYYYMEALLRLKKINEGKSIY